MIHWFNCCSLHLNCCCYYLDQDSIITAMIVTAVVEMMRRRIAKILRAFWRSYARIYRWVSVWFHASECARDPTLRLESQSGRDWLCGFLLARKRVASMESIRLIVRWNLNVIPVVIRQASSLQVSMSRSICWYHLALSPQINRSCSNPKCTCRSKSAASFRLNLRTFLSQISIRCGRIRYFTPHVLFVLLLQVRGDWLIGCFQFYKSNWADWLSAIS